MNKSSTQPNHPAATPLERKRDRLLPFLKSASGSPSPNTSGAASQQVPSPTPTTPAIQQAAPCVPSTGGSSDLWTQAYLKLPDQLKKQLGVYKPGEKDKLQTLQSVLRAAVDAKEANIANRLKLRLGNKEIDVQETADRLVGWITKFKEVGDIAVQYDPVHAALPWAGVRFILLVRHTPLQ